MYVTFEKLSPSLLATFTRKEFHSGRGGEGGLLCSVPKGTTYGSGV